MNDSQFELQKTVIPTFTVPLLTYKDRGCSKGSTLLATRILKQYLHTEGWTVMQFDSGCHTNIRLNSTIVIIVTVVIIVSYYSRPTRLIRQVSRSNIHQWVTADPSARCVFVANRTCRHVDIPNRKCTSRTLITKYINIHIIKCKVCCLFRFLVLFVSLDS
jgi:hypothetical protein